MRCKDTWKKTIPPEKLTAYKQLIQEGRIQNPHVTFNKRTGYTTIEYDADGDIKDELKRRCTNA